jgi:hypothetical protein
MARPAEETVRRGEKIPSELITAIPHSLWRAVSLRWTEKVSNGVLVSRFHGGRGAEGKWWRREEEVRAGWGRFLEFGDGGGGGMEHNGDGRSAGGGATHMHLPLMQCEIWGAGRNGCATERTTVDAYNRLLRSSRDSK